MININKKNQKGIIPLLILLVVAVVLIGGYFLITKFKLPGLTLTTPTPVAVNASTVPQAYQQQYTNGAQQVAPINNSSDLTKTSADLDSTNTAQLDSQLNQLNSVSNF